MIHAALGEHRTTTARVELDEMLARTVDDWADHDAAEAEATRDALRQIGALED